VTQATQKVDALKQLRNRLSQQLHSVRTALHDVTPLLDPLEEEHPTDSSTPAQPHPTPAPTTPEAEKPAPEAPTQKINRPTPKPQTAKR
jgi:hypothetical protein